MDQTGDMASGARRDVLVGWTPFHGRNRGLSEELGVEILDLRTQIPDRVWTSPARWLVLGVKTWRALRRARPTGAIVMQPPVFVLAVTVWFARGRFPIVVDLHHGPFEEPRWTWSMPWTLRLMRKCDLAVVTNPVHRERLTAEGIPCVELHDPPVPWDLVPDEETDDHVFVPLSYSPDEPVDELLTAARVLSDVPFMLTGRAPAEVKSAAPDNVTFVGFVPDDEYVHLLSSAAAVACFTDKPNTMQRGGYEALAAGRPLITSDSVVLREYFGEAATYADPESADSIREAVAGAVADRVAMSKTMTRLRADYREAYPAGLEPIRDALNAPSTRRKGG